MALTVGKLTALKISRPLEPGMHPAAPDSICR
jgi:hypothetical protein